MAITTAGASTKGATRSISTASAGRRLRSPPTIEHSHAEFRSLTGGVVYHGDVLPRTGRRLHLRRLFQRPHLGHEARWPEGALAPRAGRHHAGDRRASGSTSAGECWWSIWPAGSTGSCRRPRDEPTRPFPARLSETGLVRVDGRTSPRAGRDSLLGQRAPAGTTARVAERFIAVPGDARIGYHSGRSWDFPDGTALVQTLSLERQPGNPASRLRVETRVLLRQQGEWAGYSYRWNADQSDAALVARRRGRRQVGDRRGRRHATSNRGDFPAATECMTCHSRAASFVLGLTEAQLNRVHDYGGVPTTNYGRSITLGCSSERLAKPPAELTRLADPCDASADLEVAGRARTCTSIARCATSRPAAATPSWS